MANSPVQLFIFGIFEHKWGTRKHIDDLKKYSGCIPIQKEIKPIIWGAAITPEPWNRQQCWFIFEDPNVRVARLLRDLATIKPIIWGAAITPEPWNRQQCWFIFEDPNVRVARLLESLATIMCCRLFFSASSQCLHHYWVIVNWALENKFSEIRSNMQIFLFKIMNLKMPSAKWRPFCLGVSALTQCGLVMHRSGLTLVQVMACCLTAPSHHLN